ncbi:MAG: chorismate synthase, partial [Bdellovibrionales bacterium]|nr:chorismate synthase [Bdellovibrionales bacterium]
MSANSFGNRFKITSFGESHGVAMGVIIDGCPAGVPFDNELLMKELKRRRPGSHEGDTNLNSDRKEKDEPEVLSGVYAGLTLGTPIAIVVRNQDMRSKDYDEIKSQVRRGHADQVWKSKFGHSDHRGGGRSSGRETIARVMAGAVAQMVLQQVAPSLEIFAFAQSIGPLFLTPEDRKILLQQSSPKQLYIDTFPARFPKEKQKGKITQLLSQAKIEGKSYGGIASFHILNSIENLGQPVFHKLKSDLAQAFMSIGATSGVELGAGFAAPQAEGSQFHQENDSNHYGGIQGGISTGDPIEMTIAFKPTASVLDTAKKGRHDPCIVPRALPVIEAMAKIVVL